MKTYGIILASGQGNRFGTQLPKQFTKLGDKTLIEHTLDVFENSDLIDEIIVVVTPNYIEFSKDLLSNYTKVSKILAGGETRKDSSFIGVNSISDNEAKVLIHDCARPFLSHKVLKDCVLNLDKHDAVAVAIPTIDTIIEVENNVIQQVPDRTKMMCIQTPQCFKLSIIKQAHFLSQNDNNFTDDCGLVIKHRLADIKIVLGEIENIKITYPDDFYRAEQILKQREKSN